MSADADAKRQARLAGSSGSTFKHVNWADREWLGVVFSLKVFAFKNKDKGMI